MNENTRFEEYERKTRKIILIIGIISGLFFLFGLLIISTEVKQYNPEENTPDFVENVLLMLDYIIEYFKRNKLVLRLVERNFSWPMVARQMSERSDPLWDRLMSDLERSPQASRYSEEELFRIIFVIVEMVGSVCYSSIIEGKPDTIDNMKPVLYGIVRNILR